MARLMTIGNESAPVATDSFATFEGRRNIGGGASVSSDTGVKRSGSASYACDSGASNALAYVTLFWGLLGNNGYYLRFYIHVQAIPGSEVRLGYLMNSGGTPLIGVRLASSGALRLYNETTPVQIGSDSTPITASNWHRVELYGKTVTGASDEATLRLDGVQVAAATGLTVSDTQIYGAEYGWLNSPGANNVIRLDDVAVNDDTGGSNNSWPGEGRVVYLRPVSDNARDAGWVAGAGATTNLWDAVDNLPPAGVAGGSASDLSQIKNGGVSTTENYDANVASYAAAGLSAADTITLVQAAAMTGTDTTVNGAGAVKIVSNPTQSGEDAKTFGNGSAVAGYGTNWQTQWGTAQTSPSVTLATQPVLRVGRRTATVMTMHVCDMLAAVEYRQGGGRGLLLTGVGA